jgi:uncharacterized cupin superfamily protein
MNTPLPRPLSLAALTGPREPVPAEKLRSGQPAIRYASAFATHDGHFDVGLWEGTPGSWQVAYTENEVCLLLAGRVRLTASSGEIAEFAAGEAFLVPAGFQGEFAVLESARKLYAIYQP